MIKCLWVKAVLRSANRNNSYNVWNVNTDGNVNNNNARNTNRVLPTDKDTLDMEAITV